MARFWKTNYLSYLFHLKIMVEVQVALLTEQIKALTEHLKKNHKDAASKRGLMILVGQRRSLLDYLARTDRDAYLKLIVSLGLRK